MQFERFGSLINTQHAQESNSPRLYGTTANEVARAPFQFDGDEERYFTSLCAYYSEELRAHMPVVQEKERNNNVRAVNAHQARFLRERSQPEIEINPNVRRLNLYYRTGSDGRAQMDPFEFAMITWILNWYIHEGHSRVFNALSLVSRLEGNYPHIVHSFSPKIEYLNVRGEEFHKACAIGANTIHLTHGTTIENEYGSVPILGQSSREDSVIMDTCTNYIPLQLYYPEAQRPNNRDLKLGETDFSGSFTTVMIETIRAVQALEESMLAETLS